MSLQCGGGDRVGDFYRTLKEPLHSLSASRTLPICLVILKRIYVHPSIEVALALQCVVVQVSYSQTQDEILRKSRVVG